MKVLQINATYGIGSTGVIVKDLQSICHENNIECNVAFSTKKQQLATTCNDFCFGNKLTRKIHSLFSRIEGKQGYFSLIDTYRFLRYLSRQKPDIIHLHNLHSSYINLNILLRYIAKNDITTVITLHDCWFFTGGCFHYTNIGCDKWKSECGGCPKRYQDTPAYLWDASKSILSDRKKYLGSIKNIYIVGVSEWLAGEVRKSFLREKKVLSIANGVDTSIFKPTISNIKEYLQINNKFVILGPGSKWLSNENKDVFSEFCSLIEDDMVFVLYGCSDTKMAVPTNVKLYKYTSSQTELAQVYSIADVFVNSSREDSLPFTNLEPQACGVPVITFANTGSKETVDENCSFTVKNDDIKSMFSRIKLIKQAGKNYYKEECINWICNNFAKRTNYEKYITLFNEIHK